jgi:hypothetical protein
VVVGAEDLVDEEALEEASAAVAASEVAAAFKEVVEALEEDMVAAVVAMEVEQEEEVMAVLVVLQVALVGVTLPKLPMQHQTPSLTVPRTAASQDRSSTSAM